MMVSDYCVMNVHVDKRVTEVAHTRDKVRENNKIKWLGLSVESVRYVMLDW